MPPVDKTLVLSLGETLRTSRSLSPPRITRGIRYRPIRTLPKGIKTFWGAKRIEKYQVMKNRDFSKSLGGSRIEIRPPSKSGVAKIGLIFLAWGYACIDFRV